MTKTITSYVMRCNNCEAPVCVKVENGIHYCPCASCGTEETFGPCPPCEVKELTVRELNQLARDNYEPIPIVDGCYVIKVLVKE